MLTIANLCYKAFGTKVCLANALIVILNQLALAVTLLSASGIARSLHKHIAMDSMEHTTQIRCVMTSTALILISVLAVTKTLTLA
jgi:fumarate reductase subunit C